MTSTGPRLLALLGSELADLGLADDPLVRDLLEHVAAEVTRQTSGTEGAGGAESLSVDQAGAVALSVLTGAVALADARESADGDRAAYAVERQDELDRLTAELGARRASPRHPDNLRAAALARGLIPW